MSPSQTEVRAAVLAPTASAVERLKKQLDATGKIASVSGVSAYLQLDEDALLGWLSRVAPQIVLLELEDGQGMEILSLLNSRHPEIWFLITSTQDDPDFIIASVRAGAREFLKHPVSQEVLQAAVDRFLSTLQQRQERKGEGTVYSVIAAKEGSGATSVAINLAASISKLPNTKVALLDFGVPLGDVASYLDIRSQFRVTDALTAGERLDSVLLQTFVTEVDGVEVLPGFAEYGQDATLEPGGVRNVLEVVQETYTHAVVDLPGTLLQENLSLLADFCPRLLVVLTAELPTIWRAYRLLDFIENRGLKNRVRLVLNRFEKNNDISVSEIEKTLRRDIDWMIPNDYRSSIAAIHASHAAVELNHSRLGSGYAELARDLTGIRMPGSKGGLFSFLSKKGN